MRYFVVFMLFVLVGCGSQAEPLTPSGEPSFDSTIEGTVTYRERMALPENAVLRVGIYDTSLQDVSATPINEQVFPISSQVPIDFEIGYNQADINPRNTYSLGVAILANGQLLFINTTSYSVLTNGTPVTNIEVLLERVGS